MTVALTVPALSLMVAVEAEKATVVAATVTAAVPLTVPVPLAALTVAEPALAGAV